MKYAASFTCEAQLLPVSLRNRYKLGGDMVGKNLNIFQQDFTTLPELNITRTTYHPFWLFWAKIEQFLVGKMPFGTLQFLFLLLKCTAMCTLPREKVILSQDCIT